MITEIDLSTFKFRRPIVMRWSDCDMLGHVNNAVYLTYAEQARTEYCENLNWNWDIHGVILAKAEVNFKKPLLYTDKPIMYVKTTKIGNKSFEMTHIIMDEKGESPELIATITCVGVMVNYATGLSFIVPESIRQIINSFEGTQL